MREIITQRYRRETGLSAYKFNWFGKKIHNQDYINWLEKQCTINVVSKSLMDKKWAEARERTARVREQIAIEKFIEVYWDEDYTPTFEEINERLKLH